MLANQKLQNALDEMCEISHLQMALYTGKGKMIAVTEDMKIPARIEHSLDDFIASAAEQQICQEYHFYKINVNGETEFVLLCYVSIEGLAVCAQMAACQIRNMAVSHAEQFDKSSFIQNILLGNMLIVDILSKAKRYHISSAPRVVFVIDTGDKNNEVCLELVKNLADLRQGDFVTGVDTHSVVLVKDVSLFDESKLERQLGLLADSLVDSIHMEAMVKVRVGYGNVVHQLQEIGQSYQEAKMALEVGRVFYAEYDTISYGKLGIGRLIYQLPMSLCDMFIKEVFGDKIPDILEDEEAMTTIQKFFENNLNISETARQLYVHRNTLVYRLERIEKTIGLDIRTFEDAMTFRIAVMVIAHMKNQRSLV